jgi:DNA polymerase/3'-5' exonuclease PolX
MKIKKQLSEMRLFANEIIEDLRPYAERIEIAGSIRRNKPEVADVEIIYIPKYKETIVNQDLFGNIEIKKTDLLSEYILDNKDYDFRLNKLGSKTYGLHNKLMLFKDVPLDLFSASEHNFAIIKLIRTGSFEFNIFLAQRALAIGSPLKEYEGGTIKNNKIIQFQTEQEIFEYYDIKYLTPEERTDPKNFKIL